MAAAIRTEGLTKRFGRLVAVDDVALEVHEGDLFGFLGPNGSGKTTTTELLLGLLFPTAGDAFVFGEPAAKVEKNERIGYLPEESYLYRFLNAEEKAQGRPVGVTLDKSGALLVADDVGNTVWRVARAR